MKGNENVYVYFQLYIIVPKYELIRILGVNSIEFFNKCKLGTQFCIPFQGIKDEKKI